MEETKKEFLPVRSAPQRGWTSPQKGLLLLRR